MDITKEMLEQNAAKINGQIGGAIFEAGKNVGKLEGARDILLQLKEIMEKQDAETLTTETVETLKIAGAEAGETQA